MIHHTTCQLFATVAAVALLAGPVAAADNPTPYDQVDLSASAEQDVNNDLLVAIMYFEAQADRQRDVADKVNTTMQWALDTAKAVREVDTQTMQYSTYPVYETDNRVIGWRARQSMRMESHDVKALTDLVGRLQERIAVESIGYAVSKQARDSAEEKLVSAAISQFKARADLIAKEFGRDGYRIVRISVGTGGGMPVPMPYMARAMEMKSDSGIAAPAMEAGTQTMNVSVNGTIELAPIQ